MRGLRGTWGPGHRGLLTPVPVPGVRTPPRDTCVHVNVQGRGPHGAGIRGAGLTSLPPHPSQTLWRCPQPQEEPCRGGSTPRLRQAHRGPGPPPRCTALVTLAVTQGPRRPGQYGASSEHSGQSPLTTGSPTPACGPEGTEIEETSVPAASFATAETRTPSKCPSTDEWTEQLQCTCP